MSDNIPPFDIQMEIVKKVSDVKSLVQFRLVSKPWKLFIDSSQFIKGYGARHTQPPSHIVSFSLSSGNQGCEKKFICLVDHDDNNIEMQQHEFAPSVVPPLLKQCSYLYDVVGACHGLLCAFALLPLREDYYRQMAVIWNPLIRKSYRLFLPSLSHSFFGFGVCPVTKDPIVLSMLQMYNKPRRIEVITLSSGVRNVIPTANLPRQSIQIGSATLSSQVVIDRFIYWDAYEQTFSGNVYLVVSFDLITKEFKVVDLPDSFAKELCSPVCVSKLRDSLVVSGQIKVEGALCCDVWVMDHDSSFNKLFTIGAPVHKVLGFKQNGEAILEARKEDGTKVATLFVYDPCSQQIKNLGIFGDYGSFFMGSYQESLLLLDHSDSYI